VIWREFVPTEVQQSKWNTEVLKAYLKYTEQVQAMTRAEVKQTSLDPIGSLLTSVNENCSTKANFWSFERLVDWWSGRKVELTWSLLHEVEQQIIKIAPKEILQEILEVATSRAHELPNSDPAKARLTDFVSQMKGPLGSQDVAAD
jgi:hypothetical protein